MKIPVPSLAIVAVLVGVSAVAAQSDRSASASTLPRRADVLPAYHLNSEVTIQGSIQSVVRKSTAGLMFGGHLIVSTTQGIVDVQIGKFILSGPKPSSFATGEQIRAVGMMTTFHNRPVLLARLVQTPGSTIEVRNEQGIEISPIAREALARNASSTGGVQ